MKTIDLRVFKDEFVIHYGCAAHRVKANTFAQSLIKISDSLKITDEIVNPGYELEIYVEALGVGSFRVKIKSFKKSVSNIFSASNVKTVSLAIVAALIWDNIQVDKEIKIIVKDDAYILETEDERIILPIDAEQYFETIKKIDSVKRNIYENFEILDKDKSIDDFGFSDDMNDSEPKFYVSRKVFAILSSHNQNGDRREKIEVTKLLIVRAILEKSDRMWQFIWNGNTISAPIKDENFYDNFVAHKIQIAWRYV